MIECCRAPTENIPILNYLIQNATIVRYKSVKHGRTAMDWARLMKYGDSIRILELGGIVQSQIVQLFNDIACGNQDKVISIIQDGNPFDPNGEALYFKLMEEHIVKARQGNQNVRNIRNQLAENAVSLHQAEETLQQSIENVKEIESQVVQTVKEQDDLNMLIMRACNAFEKASTELIRSDLEELQRIKTFNLTLKISLFAFGILFHALDRKAFPVNIYDDYHFRQYYQVVETLFSDEKLEDTR